ncbi:unnamed protein product [Linum tenue]|uniref:CCT domain-containing protein n=1 Tax=Linum tenue TaxID=586396 RepID=A0AAV0RD28_9ROSI|nr:unnamed protein product [Linum tenue]
MLSLVANHHRQEENSLFATTPNHYAAMPISSSSLHELLNTTSSSFESDRVSSFSPDRDPEAILFNNIGSGMTDNVDGGSITASFGAATNCYHGQQPTAAANYVRAPSAAAVAADMDNYYVSMHTYSFNLSWLMDYILDHGTTKKTTQLCNNSNISADVKVGQYTAEERKDRILRYLNKRNQRNFNKTIKYACRKTLADRRVRVRGRFARNSSSEDNNRPYNENDVGTHNVQLVDNKAGGEEEEDEWLQEAMASLLYAPYIAAG